MTAIDGVKALVSVARADLRSAERRAAIARVILVDLESGAADIARSARRALRPIHEPPSIRADFDHRGRRIVRRSDDLEITRDDLAPEETP